MNPKIRGWANYHCHICAKETFSKVGHLIFTSLWQWAKRRHPNKGSQWIRHKYFRQEGYRQWVFTATIKDAKGNKVHLDLADINKTPIKRHIKIQAEATPYDPAYQDYFAQRLMRRREKRLSRKCPSSWSPWLEMNALAMSTEAG